MPTDDLDVEYAHDHQIDEDTSGNENSLPPVHTGPAPPDQGDAGPDSVKHLALAGAEQLHRRYHSISGLSPQQRAVARHIVYSSAMLLLHNSDQVHYTQGSERWQGIDRHLIAAKGQFPRESDCSSSSTWELAQALHFHFNLPDIVNGLGWRGGWTGTMARHGREVEHVDRVLRGDQVFYGPGPDYEHVATIVHHKGLREPLIISHGSQGAYLIPYTYRGDHAVIRRYI